MKNGNLFLSLWRTLFFLFLFSTLSIAFNQSNIYAELKNQEMDVLLYQAIQKTVKGKVTDEKGEPLPGVTITIVGTPKGVITDIDGAYSIEVSSAGNLEFSFVGLETQRVQVDNRTTIDVVLKENVDELDEVVVVAFGKQKKSDLIGSVTSKVVTHTGVPILILP